MNEVIDKAATLNIIKSFISSLRPEATGLICEIYDAVLHMQAEQPKLKGKWILVDGYRCSVCNYKLLTTGLPMYCPHCSARMEGDEE